MNAHVEYWQYDPDLFTTYPFTELDANLIAELGWNVVRLLLSWSRVEPEPGNYDASYLDQIETAIRMLDPFGQLPRFDDPAAGGDFIHRGNRRSPANRTTTGRGHRHG